LQARVRPHPRLAHPSDPREVSRPRRRSGRDRPRRRLPAAGTMTGTRRANLLPGLSLWTWLLGSHLLVLLLPMLALIGTGALAMDLRHQTRADLEHQADVLTVLLAELLTTEGQLDPLDPLLAEIRGRTLASVQVVDTRARVIAASGEPEQLDLSDDPVVARAL